MTYLIELIVIHFRVSNVPSRYKNKGSFGGHFTTNILIVYIFFYLFIKSVYIYIFNLFVLINVYDIFTLENIVKKKNIVIDVLISVERKIASLSVRINLHTFISVYIS